MAHKMSRHMSIGMDPRLAGMDPRLARERKKSVHVLMKKEQEIKKELVLIQVL